MEEEGELIGVERERGRGYSAWEWHCLVFCGLGSVYPSLHRKAVRLGVVGQVNVHLGEFCAIADCSCKINERLNSLAIEQLFSFECLLDLVFLDITTYDKF